MRSIKSRARRAPTTHVGGDPRPLRTATVAATLAAPFQCAAGYRIAFQTIGTAAGPAALLAHLADRIIPPRLRQLRANPLS
jgi:hypothetical protein